MSSLDDLRATLDRHADDLDDTERYVRPVAVRARIRAVRRRRATVAAVAAVLVLVAGVAGAATLRGPSDVDPAGQVVVGVDVPATIDVQQFPYGLAQLADVTDDQVHVDPRDHDQAVLLAARGLGTGSATLYSQGEPIARVHGDQQVSAPVAIGVAGIDLRVRFDGTGADARAGVAVYEATGELAPGVDDGDAVFRNQVAGASLVAGAFSSPGETSVKLDARSSGGPLRFAFYCTAEDDGLWLNVSVDGGGALGSGCGDTDPDAGVGTWATARYPAGDHRVRVFLTDGSDGPEVAPPDGAVIGVGIYDPPADGPRVMGTRVDSHVEYGGRDWILDEVVGAPTTVDTTDGDVLLGFVGRGDPVGASWAGRLTHGETPQVDSPHDASTTLGSVLLAGDRYAVTIDGGEGRLLVYRPV
jgi:hypothetical protein